MTMWTVTVGATLDKAPDQGGALQLGRQVAGEALTVASVQNTRFSITAAVDQDDADPAQVLTRLADEFGRVLRGAGYKIEGWEQLELLSPEEAERRLASAAMPKMVSAAAFAEMLGVSKQRVYELEQNRRRAAKAGRGTDFPSPVVPGWWLLSSAEQYARSRNRTGGRPRKDS